VEWRIVVPYLVKIITLTILALIELFIVIGITWIFAAIFNPDLTSETIWFLGILLGTIANRSKISEHSKSWDEEFG
jgi:hypothetical protein